MLRPNREHHYLEFTSTYKAWLRWALVLVAVLIGGLPGLLAVFIAQGLLMFGGDESAAKHGINTNQASRLGGVVVYGFVCLSLLLHVLIFERFQLGSDVTAILVAASVFFVIGLFEDLRGILSAGVRFVAMVICAGAFLYLQPQFILRHSGLPFMDEWVLSFAPIGVLFTLFGVVFFVNAFNTADGANGLISGVCIFTVLGLVQLPLESAGGVLALLGIGCFIFWLFNVTIGRIFMGDGGAYFLGAIVSLTLIWLVNEGIADVWYLLSLTFYPHADLLFSMLRRTAAGASLLGADNGHFHNLLFRRLAQYPTLKKQANTATGLIIALVFAGFPLLVNQLGYTGNWLFIYLLLWLAYSLNWGLLSGKLGRKT